MNTATYYDDITYNFKYKIKLLFIVLETRLSIQHVSEEERKKNAKQKFYNIFLIFLTVVTLQILKIVISFSIFRSTFIKRREVFYEYNENNNKMGKIYLVRAL